MTHQEPDGPGPVQPPATSMSYKERRTAQNDGVEAVAPSAAAAGLGRDENIEDNYVKQQKPINAAVHNAFGDAKVSGVDQEDLVARITQQVLKQLQSTPGVFGLQHMYQPSPVVPISPDASLSTSPPRTALPPRDVYTPPSPHKMTDFTSSISEERRGSFERKASPQSPRLSKNSVQSEDAQADLSPQPAVRPTSAFAEESTIEKIWGKLFDEKQMPTPKLSQLLRGTAMHLIEAYEPKNSLVVTPQKLQQFYREHPIPNEPYPWELIFDDEESHISRMYRELECEHHLIQCEGVFCDKPDIPGLTPRGFQHWATLLILAHPDEAFQRFQNVVQGLPISNPDDKTERFPKELPRKLFPTEPDWHVRQRLVHAIEEHAHISVQSRDHSEGVGASTCAPVPQPPSQQKQATSSPPRSESGLPLETPSVPHIIERDRKPYSTLVSKECAIDDTRPSDSTAPNPIERTRKPYSATPGQGRSFTEEELSSSPKASCKPPSLNTASSLPPPPSSSLRRTNSSASSARPINIPPPPSMKEREWPPSGSSYTANRRGSMPRRRHHSPPPAAGFRSSEGDLSGFGPSSFESRYIPPWAEGSTKEPGMRRMDAPYWQGPGLRGDRVAPGYDGEARRPIGPPHEEFYGRPRRETTGSRPI